MRRFFGDNLIQKFFYGGVKHTQVIHKAQVSLWDKEPSDFGTTILLKTIQQLNRGKKVIIR